MKSTPLIEIEQREGTASAWTKRREDEARVLRSIEELCDRERPGTRIPTHTELMRQLNASERSVLRSLAELKRRGRIVRRHGSGTYVGNPDGMYPLASMGPDAASKTIVVIAKPDHGFFDECISRLYSHADSRDYEIIYQLLRSEHDTLTDLRPVLGSAAGFIIFGYYLAPLAKSLMAAGNSVVVVGAPNADDEDSVPCVCNDHEAGGYLAVNHLIKLGHRRIGFQYGNEREFHSPRRIGNRRALDDARRAGLAVTDVIIDTPKLEAWDAEPATVRRDLCGPDSPTALVAWNDFTASRILDVLQRAQMRVPEDISVIGYDNASIAERLTPGLTTIDSGIGQLLGVAVKTVVASKTNGSTMMQMTIPSLVIRQSVSKPQS